MNKGGDSFGVVWCGMGWGGVVWVGVWLRCRMGKSGCVVRVRWARVGCGQGWGKQEMNTIWGAFLNDVSACCQSYTLVNTYS